MRLVGYAKVRCRLQCVAIPRFLVRRIDARLGHNEFRLNPFSDPFRGDLRFEQVIASLAPND